MRVHKTQIIHPSVHRACISEINNDSACVSIKVLPIRKKNRQIRRFWNHACVPLNVSFFPQVSLCLA
jgi:hypothetical protein